MRIILSPAKKMKEEPESLPPSGLPEYIGQAEEILKWMKQQSREELQKLWNCNDKITDQNVERLKHMELRQRLSPAILSYEGIAYLYLRQGSLRMCRSICGFFRLFTAY